MATMPGSGVPALRSPRELLAPALGDELAVRSIASFGDLRRMLQHVSARRVAGSAACSLIDVAHRDQRVEQGLVAELGAAACLDALDRRAEHFGQVLQRDRGLVLAELARLHEARAPDRARAAADVLGDDHGDLEQHRADGALVDRPIRSR